MSSKNSADYESVLNALRTVNDPDLQKDLVSLNMIRDLTVAPNGDVKLTVMLTTPACPLKAKIEADVREALGKVTGVGKVEVKMDAQVRSSVKQANAIAGVKHIIAVSSGKGGVGKSTVAANLAVSLALEGARVGLMDADVYGPNIPTMLGVTEQPLIEKHPTLGEVLVPPMAHGVRVMSMGFLIKGDQPLIWRGPMLHSVVNQFCHQVAWGELDYLIVDMPPGTGDVQLSLAQLVPVTGTVIVTTPQEVSAQDVRKAINMFEKVRVPILGIVENMSYFECDGCTKKHYLFGEGGGKTIARKFSVDLLAELPLMAQVREGGDEGCPIVVKDPASPVAVALRELTRQVARKVAVLTAHSVAGTGEQIVQIGKFS